MGSRKPDESIKDRNVELRFILTERRRQILGQVQGRVRDITETAVAQSEVTDSAEQADGDIQDDIEFALIQMRSETLLKIDEALARLGDGTYGNCAECGDPITTRRLRAVPFAVRCKDCEEAKESAESRDRQSR